MDHHVAVIEKDPPAVFGALAVQKLTPFACEGVVDRVGHRFDLPLGITRTDHKEFRHRGQRGDVQYYDVFRQLGTGGITGEECLTFQRKGRSASLSIETSNEWDYPAPLWAPYKP